jgi:NADH:ubiquinone oxidoreductase subunit D
LKYTSEFLQTDLTLWELGPYHPFLPGPIRLALTLDGEVIVSSEIETGFLHRGLEKAFERRLWQSALAYADHLDPEGAVFGELAVCPLESPTDVKLAFECSHDSHLCTMLEVRHWGWLWGQGRLQGDC